MLNDGSDLQLRLLEGQSNCHPYVEDFQEHYERIGYMVDPNSPDKMKLNPIYEASTSDALKLYAYASQGTYGDVTGEQPSIFDIKNRALWDAWAECRGMSKHEAK